MTTATSRSHDDYFTLVPRGLHYAFEECLRSQIQKAAGSNNYDVEVIWVGELDPTEDRAYLETISSLLAQKNARKRSPEPVCSPHLLTGSVNLPEINKFRSVGYHHRASHCADGDERPAATRRIWSCGGDSSVWVRFTTNAPVDFVANHLRFVGPLVASVQVLDEHVRIGKEQSREDVTAHIQKLLKSRPYPFQKALHLWKEHACCSWGLTSSEQEELNQEVNGDSSLKYRVSCMRVYTKQYAYSRQQLVVPLVDTLVPLEHTQLWTVDMTKYDVEIVLFVQSNSLAVGLALRPYQRLGAKSWADGCIPPDVTPPHLSGQTLGGSMVRLRPTNAQLLLHVAGIQPGDVVLDPCAGVGTIPMECPSVAFGGDVVLTPEGLGPAAARYIRQVRRQRCAGDLVAWDATCLPLRSSSVDVVVSDLPFGQQCLSSNKLGTLLPLLLGEVGRVLLPVSGRMILLCGSFRAVIDALEQLNEAQPEIWEMPCQSVFPVNIGGLLAWVLAVKRGSAEGRRIPNHLERARKMAHKRYQVTKSQEWKMRQASNEGRTKVRRIQE